MTTEELEVRVWSVVVLTLNFILLGSVAAILYAVMFVEHDMERISPIDQQFLSILKEGERGRCGGPLWVIGSAASEYGCVTCITMQATPDSDFEIDEACE